MTDPLRERFWAKVDKGPNDGCWEWTGTTDYRYGLFTVNHKQTKAHRVAYEWERGPIPQGLTVDHLCRNTRCVNPTHLELVTGRENTLRGIGPTARNARATHCKRGHPLSGSNLYQSPGRPRSRLCRACRAMEKAASWRAKAEGRAS